MAIYIAKQCWGLDILNKPHPGRQILSSRRGLFKGLRTDAAEMTVATGPVIEHFSVIEDGFVE